MTNITITINAPELVQALTAFVNAVDGGKAGTAPQTPQQQAAPAVYQQQVPQTNPAAQMPAQQYGTQAPAYAPPGQQSVYVQQIPLPATPPSGVPTAAQTYTMEQLSVAGTQLVDAGRMMELQQLLAGFGVNSMMQLPKEQYGAFATQLRAMGAKI